MVSSHACTQVAGATVERVCVCVHLCTAVRRLTLCNVFLESLCVEVEGPGLFHSRTAASSDCFLEASLVTWSEAEKRVYERFISS